MFCKKKRIIIFGAVVYGGGAIVLAELCRSLLRLGYDTRLLMPYTVPLSKEESESYIGSYLYASLTLSVKMLFCKIFPFRYFRNRFHYDFYHQLHLKGCKIKWIPLFDRSRTVVLYPEVVYGNPLRAKYVARWLLYHYKFWGEQDAYDDSDLFVGYREVFNKEALVPDIENVRISFFDHNLYRQTNFGPRTGKCYIIRKGCSRTDLPDSFDGPVIDDFTEEEKVAVLNSCEYCYSYDTQTFYSEIASICGCKSVVVLEKGKTVMDYIGDGDMNYGVAFGEEDIPRALNTRDKLLENIFSGCQSNSENAGKFISLVEKHFHIKVRKRYFFEL